MDAQVSRRTWAALLFVAALAFFFGLRRHDLTDMGEAWALTDAGKQLYQPVRTLEGQLFYRDFSTDNYQPASIVWHAALFKLFGVRTSVMRASLAVVGAVIAALSFAVARRLMPAGWAFLAYLLSLTWNVLNLNIGYPAWYCTALGLAAVLAMDRYTRSEKAGWLVFAGVLVGLSAAFKINQGVFQFIGLGLFLAWRGVSHGSRLLLSWEGAYAGLAGLAGLIFAWGSPIGINRIVFAIPIALASAAVLARIQTLRVSETLRVCSADGGRPRSFLAELAWLSLGAAMTTAAWATPAIFQMGWELFWDGTLLAPLRHGAFMHRPVLLPNLNGWLALLWLIAGASGCGAGASATGSSSFFMDGFTCWEALRWSVCRCRAASTGWRRCGLPWIRGSICVRRCSS